MLKRIFGKIRWWFRWEVLRFPQHCKDYGVSYALRKIFLNWWWNDLKYGVGNLITWFPVIWKDRNWDYRYWITINIKKLREMEKLIRDHGNHVYHVRDADNIRKAILALERLQEDDYLSNVNMFHDKEYGELEINWIPLEDELANGDKLYQADFKTTKWDELSEGERKLGEFIRHKNYKRADYLKKQDLEYATKIINKYLFHWWD